MLMQGSTVWTAFFCISGETLSVVQAETQEQLQSAHTQLHEDDRAATLQVQQEQPGSLVQEGIWVMDLTVDDPTATKDGGDTYMVCAALVASARTCTYVAYLLTAWASWKFHATRHVRQKSYLLPQCSMEGHMISPCVILRMQHRCRIDVQV